MRGSKRSAAGAWLAAGVWLASAGGGPAPALAQGTVIGDPRRATLEEALGKGAAHYEAHVFTVHGADNGDVAYALVMTRRGAAIRLQARTTDFRYIPLGRVESSDQLKRKLADLQREKKLAYTNISTNGYLGDEFDVSYAFPGSGGAPHVVVITRGGDGFAHIEYAPGAGAGAPSGHLSITPSDQFTQAIGSSAGAGGGGGGGGY